MVGLRQSFGKNSFFKKVLISIMMLTLMIIVIYAMMIYFGMRKSISDVKNSANQNELAQASETIDYLFEMTKNLALFIYQDKDLVKLLHVEEKEQLNTLEYIKIRTKLNDYVHTFDHADKIIVYNSKLDTIISTEFSIEHYDKPLANAVKEYINQDMREYAEFAVLDYAAENGESSTAFLFALKDWKYIQESNRATIGILIKPDWLFGNLKVINQADSNLQKEIYILDRKGELYNSDAKPVDDERFTGLKGMILSRVEGEGYFDYDMDNVRYKVAYIKNEMCDWCIISIQPYNVFMAQINNATKLFFLVTSIIIIFGLGLAIFFSRRIYVPVNALVKWFAHKSDTISKDMENEDELSFIAKSYENAVDQISIQKRNMKSSQKYLKIYWLKRLLMESATLSLEELGENKVEKLLSIGLQEELLVIILSIDENGFFFKDTAENQRLYRYAIENITQEIITEFGRCDTVDMWEENIVVLVGAGDGEALCLQQVEEGVRKIQQAVSDFYKFSLSAAVSDKMDNYTDISRKYKKALHLLSYKLIYGNGCIIKDEMIRKAVDSKEDMFILQKEEKLEGLFVGGNEEEFKKEINEIFLVIHNMKYSEIMGNVNYLKFLFYKFIKINFPSYLNLDEVQDFVSGKRMFSNETLEEVEESIVEIYRIVHKEGQDNISTTSRMLAGTIVKIIEENYKDPNLSQDWIASELKLSYSNVGKTFKAVEKVSIAEYVNRVRLRYACELLENSDCSISEIFSSVGFVNQSYFFTLFKRYFGCTPKQYQLQKKFQQF